MSDPRHTDPLRRLNLPGASATGTMWTTLWTWAAAIIAAVVVLGLIFGYGRRDLARNHSKESTTTGSATGSAPSAHRLGDVRAPAPATPTPADDGP
jgi:hypothetical protein